MIKSCLTSICKFWIFVIAAVISIIYSAIYAFSKQFRPRANNSSVSLNKSASD